MRLQQLHLLLTLARTGSMRASAEAMNVTQPALTKALKQLEEEFGATLVLRSPKGVRLSPAGEMLAARAATVVREIDRAKEEMAALTQQTQVTLTVGVSPAAALVLAANTIAGFHSRWPEVRIHLVDALYPKALQQLRSGELDLALGPLPPGGLGRDLHARALMASPTVIVATGPFVPSFSPVRETIHWVGSRSASTPASATASRVIGVIVESLSRPT